MTLTFASVALGGLMVIFGVIALFNPFAATIAVEQFLAWVFLIVGVLQFVAVFRGENWGQRLWSLLLALVNVWLGITLLGNPLAGIITLTYVVAIMFAVSGAAKIFLSFGMRGTGFFWAVLVSGVVSLALAVMVLSNFPQSAATLLGLLLAVELLSSGFTMIALGLSPKPAEDASA